MNVRFVIKFDWFNNCILLLLLYVFFDANVAHEVFEEFVLEDLDEFIEGV